MALVGLVLAGTGYYLGGSRVDRFYAGLWRLLRVRVETPAPVDVGPGDPGAAGAPVTPDGPGERPVLSPGATVLWTYRHEECGCEETHSRPVSGGMVGLDEPTLAGELELRDSLITAFSAELVEVATDFPGWCPEHVGRTVRLQGDELLVFAGTLEHPDRLIHIDTIPLRGSLDASLRDLLTEGHFFPDEETALRELEGIGD